jgi:hypothetical protein
MGAIEKNPTKVGMKNANRNKVFACGILNFIRAFLKYL